jgi:hypothetical protein
LTWTIELRGEAWGTIGSGLPNRPSKLIIHLIRCRHRDVPREAQATSVWPLFYRYGGMQIDRAVIDATDQHLPSEASSGKVCSGFRKRSCSIKKLKRDDAST